MEHASGSPSALTVDHASTTRALIETAAATPTGWYLVPSAATASPVRTCQTLLSLALAHPGTEAVVTVDIGTDALKTTERTTTGGTMVIGTADRTTVRFACPPILVAGSLVSRLDPATPSPWDAVVTAGRTLVFVAPNLERVGSGTGLATPGPAA